MTMVRFERSQIAPCGMNCGTCIGFLREKNRCPGCRTFYEMKAETRVRCVIRNCPHILNSVSSFCGECDKFPCKRLVQLDKRYRTKYRTSFLENLQIIKEKGIDNFLEFETGRRSCPSCGSAVSVHRNNCLVCRKTLN